MYHLINQLDNDEILLSTSSNLFLLNLKTKTLTSPLPASLLPKSHIRTVAYSFPHLALVSNSKDLQVWHLPTSTLLSTRTLYKRATCMQIHGAAVYIGDRTGDLYKYDLGGSEAELLVGHVSILTDFLFSRDMGRVVTADRDEKVRIQTYPLTYNIAHFCLGHTEYVSRLCLLPEDRFVSAGGDGVLNVWSMEGVLEGGVGIEVELGDLKPDVAEMKVHGSTLVLILQKFHGVVLYSIQGHSLTFKKVVKLDYEALGFCFTKDGSLMVTTTNTHHPLLFCDVKKGYAPTEPEWIQKLDHPTDELDDAVDLYEISKMRKWSQWQPKDKNAIAESAKRKVATDNEDEVVVEKKAIKV